MNTLVVYESRPVNNICKYIANIVKMESIGKFQVDQSNRKRASCGESEGTPAKQNSRSEVNSNYANVEEFLNVCVLLQSENLLPYAFWDCSTTQYMLRADSRLFGVNLNGPLVREQTKSATSRIKAMITNELSGKQICLMFNIVSKHKRSILSVSAQYMSEFSVKIVHLGLVVMLKKNTSDWIQLRILSILDEFEISTDQIYTITTNNGAHVSSTSQDTLAEAVTSVVNSLAEAREHAVRETEVELKALEHGRAVVLGEVPDLVVAAKRADIEDDEGAEEDLTERVESEVFQGTSYVIPLRCAAHTIQLAIYDALADHADDIVKIKKGCTDIRREISNQHLPVTLPPLANVTKWSTTFRMIQGMLQTKSHLGHLMEDDVWEFAENMMTSLGPIQKLTTKLQTEQYCFGDLMFDLMVCEGRLLSLTGPFVESLKRALKKRKEVLLDPRNLPLQTALFLDPRFNFNRCAMISADQKQVIIDYLENLYERIQVLKQRSSGQSSQDEKDAVDDDSMNRAEFELVYKQFPEDIETEQIDEPEQDIRWRLSQFGAQGFPKPYHNVQEYWKKKKHTEPELAELASVALSVPASQASVERAFSAISSILNYQGTGLNNAELEKLIFFRLNLQFVPLPHDLHL